MMNSKLLYLFFLFFIHLCSVYSFNSKHECSGEQRDVLLLFKENISTFEFDNNRPLYLSLSDRYYRPQHDYCRSLIGYAGYRPVIRNWNTSTDCCQWDGVSCNNVTGDVISLDLRCGMLKGVLELFTLFSRLPHLEVLDLSYNSLSVVTNNVTDNVNPDFRVLGLAYCELNAFPQFLQAMKNLRSLDLAGNNIHGPIPDWAGEVGGNKLVYLDLSDNSITGLSLYQWSGLEHLYLQSNMIRGQFPTTICNNMTHLKYLDMSGNSFYGVIPQCFENVTDNVNPDLRVLRLANCKLKVFPGFLRALKNMEFLDLAGNNIHGPIPDWAGEVGGNKLVYLDLSDNYITGLSLFQWSGLEHLYLQFNMIRGQFPTTICNNMTHLKYLDMSGNSFYGVIPQCFENITSSLLMINLGNNNFSGTIPKVNENCRLLEGLLLNNNQLEGDVPGSLLKCQDLKVLDLGNNYLNGTFPRWLEAVTKMEVLVLRSNNLYGAIETSSTMGFPFSRVKVFDISHNGFVGRLPGEYFENFNAIKDMDKSPNGNRVNISGSYYSITGYQVLVEYSVIDLSCNKFEGEIPNVIGSLNSLIVLNLSHNNLSGQIPHELGNLFAVESLDLSWNQLSGEIPQSLAEITTLEVLNLSQNHLEGRIPEGPQFNTFEERSFGGNLGLCGFPLPNNCDDRDMIPAQVDNDHGDNAMLPWEVVVLGYGCGTLLGLMMGYRMLSTGKPKWFNAIYDALERMIAIRRKKKKRVNVKKRNQRSNGRLF